MNRREAVRRGWCGWLISLPLVGVTLAVYAPVRQFEFVNLDDPGYVTANDRVQAGLTAAGARWAFTTGHRSNWHPLTWLSHMLDWEIFGANAGAHHLVNVLLHAANAVLLFGLLKRLTGARWRSAVVAALFALHPLHVESVAWVAERKDVLSTFFGLLTLWAYSGYVARPRAWRYAGVLALFVLGLMAKPMLVTWPFVLLLLDRWPLRRWRTEGWRRLVWEKAPFLFVALISAVVTFLVQRSSGAVIDVTEVPLAARVGNALVAYVAYLGKMFWPADLAVFYPLRPVSPWTVAGAMALLAGVTAGVACRAQRQPYLAVGWFWYLGTLVPVIGLVQVGAQRMADRYTYIPLIGLFVMLTWGVADAVGRRHWGHVTAGMAAVAVLAACAAVTAQHLPVWRNSITLFEHTLATGEASETAHVNLGTALAESERLADAMAEYQLALRLNPDSALARQGLGFILAKQGQLAEAIVQYHETLRLQPDNPTTHDGLAMVLLRAGRAAEAVVQYREVLRLQPDSVPALNNLAWLLATSPGEGVRDGVGAVRLAERARGLTRRDQPALLDTLAAAYAEAGRVADAVTTAEQAQALARAQSDAPLAEEIEERLQLYRQGRSYRADRPSSPRSQ